MQDYEKPFCLKCHSDINLVELNDHFRCSYCGSITRKHGQLTIEDFIR